MYPELFGLECLRRQLHETPEVISDQHRGDVVPLSGEGHEVIVSVHVPPPGLDPGTRRLKV